MKVNSTVALPNGLVRFHIVEATGLGILLSGDNVDIASFIKNRFLLILELGDKRILPKDKQKFDKFNANDDFFYTRYSPDTFEPVKVDVVLNQELLMCDKSLEECNELILKYLAIYNCQGNLKKELKKVYKF
jgi:hypothetical protein